MSMQGKIVHRDRVNINRFEELEKVAKKCSTCRKMIVKKLNGLADELDEHQRDVNIAKTSFASSGIVGGAVAIAGFGLSFATFGASLPLIAVGAGIGFFSGAGGIATAIADKIINSSKFNEAKEAINKFNDSYSEMMKELQYLLNNLEPKASEKFCVALKDPRIDIPENLENGKCDDPLGIAACNAACAVKKVICIVDTAKLFAMGAQEVVKTVASAAGQTGKMAIDISETATDVVKTSLKVLTEGKNAIKIGGIVLSAVGIGFDVHTVLTNAIKIHDRTPSEVAEKIRKFARELDKV